MIIGSYSLFDGENQPVSGEDFPCHPVMKTDENHGTARSKTAINWVVCHLHHMVGQIYPKESLL
jgi:hypothetical protein